MMQRYAVGSSTSKLSGRRSRWTGGITYLVGLSAVGLLLSGCRGADVVNPPPAEVKTVEAYGVKLGPQASPQEVVFVFLRSVADDYAAAKAHDRKAERKAQELTYSLAAPKTIEERIVQTNNQLNPELNQKNLGAERELRIWKNVHYWGPIIGHYLASFKDISLETLRRDSWVTISPEGKSADVYLPVAHNPAETEPAKMETATIKVDLNREAGANGEEYWRISRVRYLGRKFAAEAGPLVVQAYGLTLDANASPEQVASVAVRSLADIDKAEQAGQKDVRASATFRMFCLTDAAKVQAASKAPLAEVVDGWAKQVGAGAGSLTPEQMKATVSGSSAKVEAATSAGPISVDLVQQAAGGQNYWRVLNVKGPGTPATATAPGK